MTLNAMSGFELKKAVAIGIDTGGVGAVSITSARQIKNGASVSEILSSRFASLNLLNCHDGVALYQARDLESTDKARLVTIKVLQDTSKQPELFHLEALAAAKLSHQNVIRSSRSQIQGIHFSVLEHRPDVETLRTLLDCRGWLDLNFALGIFDQLADALEHAHGLGVLHLNVNPENILIGAEGMALLTGFGLEARTDIAWAHQARSARCPIHYISPEQASDNPLDSRSDLYSLGVVLYQMLTDRLPIDSEDSDTVKQKHLTYTPLAAHLYRADIPPSISAMIARLLEKDPERRFPDVASFRSELDRYVIAASGGVIVGEDSVPYPVEADDEIDRNQIREDSVPHPIEADDEIDHNPIREDWAAGRLEVDDEIDHSPIEVHSFSDSERRESWESPSITVITPPDEELPALGPVAETTLEREAMGRPSVETSKSVRPDITLSGNELSFDSESTIQLRPIILVAILVAAVIVGLLVLARADRSEPPNPVLLDSTTGKRSGEVGEKRDTSATLPTAGVDRRPQTDGNQLPGNMRPDAQAPAGVNSAMSSNRAAQSQRTISQASGASRRLRKPKRQWRRPTRYFRDSWRYDRRYYRSGVR